MSQHNTNEVKTTTRNNISVRYVSFIVFIFTSSMQIVSSHITVFVTRTIAFLLWFLFFRMNSEFHIRDHSGVSLTM